MLAVQRIINSQERKQAELYSARSLMGQVSESVRIVWFFMPGNLGDILQTNLLLLNTVISGDHPSVSELVSRVVRIFEMEAGPKRSIVIINLDKYFNLSGAKTMEDIRKVCRTLAFQLQNLPLDRILLHTGYIDPSLKDIFFEQNIFLVQKNLSDEKFTIGFFLRLIPVFAPETAPLRRNHLRVIPDEEVKVRIESAGQPATAYYAGNVRDIGLGGVSVFFDRDAFESIRIKDVMRMQIWFARIVIKIEASVVIWKKTDSNQVGFFFDIKDQRMISSDDVLAVAQYVNGQLKMARKIMRAYRVY